MPRLASAEAPPDLSRITAEDFVGGIIHSLAVQRGGCLTFSRYDTRLHVAMKAAYDALDERADQAGQALDFYVLPHPFHGDSGRVAEGIGSLVASGMAQTPDGSFRTLMYDARSRLADGLMDRLPGGEELYAELATVVSEAYVSAPSDITA